MKSDGMIMKSLRFYNSTEPRFNALEISGLEYDPVSTDFFYSGVGLYIDFIARSDIEGKNLWIRKISNIIVHRSLAYVAQSKTLYFIARGVK